MVEQNYIEQRITETLEKNYMPYAMSVIVSRALPEIDGLKPSHRKLLYTMYKMGLLTGNKTKSANVVGQTMKLNPHGDMAIYETLVRLTRGNEALIHPLVDSKGNFGKQYSKDMAYAAARYTEVKLDSICSELFKDIDKNTVEFIDNYDGTLKEPVLLPVTFPSILVNANQGIAVGMASNICSFNLTEVCDAAIEYMKSPEVDLLKYIKAPDLSSGGQLIYNEKEMHKIYETGKGSFKLRAKYRYDAKNNCIEIYEIPYTTTTEAIIDKIIELVKINKIKEISDLRDETDLSGLRITLDLKRNTDPDQLMNKLYKLTPLQDNFSCNFNVLIHGAPKVIGVREIIKEWIAFRIDCIKKQLIYDIGKKKEKLHLLQGLKKILLDIDLGVKIIRETEEEKQVLPNLMKGFSIDEVQAEYVAEIKLRNLNKQYILKRIDEIDALQQEIDSLQEMLQNDKKIKQRMTKELKEVAKKFGQPRKTEIIHEHHIVEITEEHFIEDYNLKLFLTHQNYLKKISLASLRASSEHKLKEEDFIVQEIETNNKADLLLFSNKQNVYKMKVHEVNDCKASSLGEYLTNLLGLDCDEKIIFLVALQEYMGYMLFGFENGKIAKVEVQSYTTKTNRRKLVKAYSDSASLIYIDYLTEDIDVVAYRDQDKASLFNTNLLTPKTTKNSQGVQALTLKKGSKMTKIERKEFSTIESSEHYRTMKIPTTGRFLQAKIENLST